MAQLNINSTVNDAFYRYKMPKLLAKVEGKGNGIKTVIVNLVDIAKALSRPPMYVCKYFGSELGSQTQFDEKNERYIVNGSNEAAKLQELLDGFIRKFVLCPNCSNPETDLSVKKGHISQKCKACGALNEIPEAIHKLASYIIKNPPEQVSKAGGATTGKKTAKKEAKKVAAETAAGTPSSTGTVTTNGKSTPPSQVPAEQVEAAGGDDLDDDWGDDTEEDKQKRLEQLTGAAKALALDTDLEKSQSERLRLLRAYLEERLGGGKIADPAQQQDILTEVRRLELADKAPGLFAEVVFDAGLKEYTMDKGMVPKFRQFVQNESLLKRMCSGNQRAQLALLRGIEKVICANMNDLLKIAPRIFSGAYQADFCEEEVFFEWSEQPALGASAKSSSSKSSKHSEKLAIAVPPEQHARVVESIQPFLKWLQEAESEESDDENDEEVAFQRTGHASAPNPLPDSAVSKAASERDRADQVGRTVCGGADELEGSDEENKAKGKGDKQGQGQGPLIAPMGNGNLSTGVSSRPAAKPANGGELEELDIDNI